MAAVVHSLGIPRPAVHICFASTDGGGEQPLYLVQKLVKNDNETIPVNFCSGQNCCLLDQNFPNFEVFLAMVNISSENLHFLGNYYLHISRENIKMRSKAN